MRTEQAAAAGRLKRRIVVFTDLDDTLFQAGRKCGPGKLHPITLTKDGLAGSFCTSGQRALLELLLENAAVIPVTARSSNAFKRVQIPFAHGAIVSFGGVILRPDGKIDAAWRRRMAGQCAGAASLLAFLLKTAEDLISGKSLACKARILSDDGLDFYLLVKPDPCHPEDLTALKEGLDSALGTLDVRIHHSNDSLALLPPFLGKAAAVSYFQETYVTPAMEDPLLIGAGDSFSDLGFLRQCAYMLLPSASQLAEAIACGERRT
ncbi:MAG: hypothetical protein LBP61_08430 [Desulfovibrio sp.]|nr:hypothetical protein [Desulfovibrio sp.]